MSDRPESQATRAGFTLVELLIVISIIGLLLGILLPAIGGARKRAQDLVCAANARSIAQSALTYATENRNWIVGAPSTSGRSILNKPEAANGSDENIEIAGDIVQPFDWAGALAWGYLTDEIPPRRRDQRFSVLNGTAGTLEQGVQASSGLGVLACPRNDNFSVPYLSGVRPEGIDGTLFQTQLSMSYTAGREFMWSSGSGRPNWASSGFWQDTNGVLYKPGYYSSFGYPGMQGRDTSTGSYFPNIDNLGSPSRKVVFADGARYQPDGAALDHDVSSRGGHGGAFADTGAWQVRGGGATHAYASGRNPSGDLWTTVSFRHGDNDTSARGNVAFFDGHVETMSIGEAQDPSLWLPSGSSVDPSVLSEEWERRYESGEGGGAFYQRNYVQVP